MVMTIGLFCSLVGIYLLFSFLMILIATYFELPIWVEYVLCFLCFPWFGLLYLIYFLNGEFHFYNDDDDEEDD